MKYIPFLDIPEIKYCQPTEYHYQQYAYYAQTVFVSQSELSKPIEFRVMASYPASCSNKTKAEKNKYAGWPKFVFGKYHDLNFLLYMDDVFAYSHGEIKFEKIRNAWDINRILCEGKEI